MEQQIRERFPGISCAYMDPEGKITTECYGFAEKENRVPVDENTIFPACSISKFITAICLMKLQEQKVLDIHLPVNAYLHRWKLRTMDGSESDATIRALMCHTGECSAVMTNRNPEMDQAESGVEWLVDKFKLVL